MSHQLSDYDYTYPEHLVAKHPLANRCDSRLLVLNKHTGAIAHHKYTDILKFFNADDVLVINNTKVFPCRLETKRQTGGRQEILMLREVSLEDISIDMSNEDDKLSLQYKQIYIWEILIDNSSKVKLGDTFHFKEFVLRIMTHEGSKRFAKVYSNRPVLDLLHECAKMPLPPYFNRDEEDDDKHRYQTIFAEQVGSVAAPTAGFHMTKGILRDLKAKGVTIIEVTLHVGLGTFLPVKTDDIRQHNMHSEFYSISPTAARELYDARISKKRITALGTTSCRVLETLAKSAQGIQAVENGRTNIFIHPPYKMKLTHRLLTNFHQPQSTLLMLVSAMAGREHIMNAYKEAIANEYRLFSYGDAMLIDSENL